MKREILLINPRQNSKKKRRGKTTGGQEMAGKKRGRKKGTIKKRSTAASVPAKKRTYKKKTTKRRRRNPQSPKSAALNLLNARSLMGIACDSAQQFGGKLACQFAAKRFTPGGGYGEDWNWKNYLIGLIGTAVASYGAEMIKRGSGRQFMTGGVSHLMMTAFVKELGPRWPWVGNYFAQADMVTDSLPTYMGTDGIMYTAGDTYQGEDGESYMLGYDGLWRAQQQGEMMGDALVPQGSLGDALVPQGSLGDAYAPYRAYYNKGMSQSSNPYARTYLS